MKKLIDYIKSSFNEVIYRVTWPKFADLQKSTVLVLVASLIFAVVIMLIDKAFEKGLELIY